tara:strand:- start:2864 stop:3472 length:609 start_codon:yes stop_codon:yes gene_type:complete
VQYKNRTKLNEIDKYLEPLESLKEQKIEDKYELDVWKANAINIVIRIYGNDSKQEEQITNVKYSSFGGISVGGPNGTYHSPSSNNISSCKKQCNQLIDGIINDLKSFGLPKLKESKDDNKGINIAINQTQSVKQKISLNIILDAIQDELTGKQLKELQNIIENDDKPENKKKKIVEKIKSFGADVATNIIAGILTNPAIYGG